MNPRRRRGGHPTASRLPYLCDRLSAEDVVELRKIGEWGLIARIRDRLPGLQPDVLKGIGDDAAVSSLSAGKELVSTVDLLIEGVHFDLSLISPRLLGRKSLAVDLSDIAAMGAKPRFTLLSLTIPGRAEIGFIDEFSLELAEMANRYDASLIGGYTSSSPGMRKEK